MTVSHPPYRRIAANLRDFAKVLEAMPDHERRKAAVGTCGCVGCRAGILAARGFPPGTLGTGARASAPASSTERAAGLTGGDHGPLTPPDPQFVGIDERLAKHLRVIWASVTEASGLVSLVNSHAPDDDPVPAGTGHCRCCETFCRPDAKNPGNRLRAGLCPPCYESRRRWQRRNPDGAYMDFVRWRRRQLSGAA